jgi:ribosomal protein L40E
MGEGCEMRMVVHNVCAVCGKRIPSGLSKCLACSLDLKKRTGEDVYLCLVCGCRTDRAAESCKGCGTNFPETSRPREDLYVCMVCGASVKRMAKACHVCGTTFVRDSSRLKGMPVKRVGPSEVESAGE